MRVSQEYVEFIRVRVLLLLFFYFKQRTAYERLISDWSSDVSSSDLCSSFARKAASRGSLAASRLASWRVNQPRSASLIRATAYPPLSVRLRVSRTANGRSPRARKAWRAQIGRASCRESVC